MPPVLKHLQSLLATSLVALLFLALGTASAHAQAKSLDDLLQQVQNADQRDAALNKQREAQFAQARDQQAGLLAQAKKDKDALDAQSAALQKQFEDNDKQITELEAAVSAAS